MDLTAWQARAKAAGLTQRLLARLTGQAENTVSRQMRGYFGPAPPKHVRSIIIAWEMMSEEQRAGWIKTIEAS